MEILNNNIPVNTSPIDKYKELRLKFIKLSSMRDATIYRNMTSSANDLRKRLVSINDDNKKLTDERDLIHREIHEAMEKIKCRIDELNKTDLVLSSLIREKNLYESKLLKAAENISNVSILREYKIEIGNIQRNNIDLMMIEKSIDDIVKYVDDNDSKKRYIMRQFYSNNEFLDEINLN